MLSSLNNHGIEGAPPRSLPQDDDSTALVLYVPPPATVQSVPRAKGRGRKNKSRGAEVLPGARGEISAKALRQKPLTDLQAERESKSKTTDATRRTNAVLTGRSTANTPRSVLSYAKLTDPCRRLIVSISQVFNMEYFNELVQLVQGCLRGPCTTSLAPSTDTAVSLEDFKALASKCDDSIIAHGVLAFSTVCDQFLFALAASE